MKRQQAHESKSNSSESRQEALEAGPELPIPIIGDVPSRDPHLGFESYATALAGAIRGGDPAQFTIGIYGAWGSGKSSLLNAVANKLQSHSDVIPVLFDAWRYESASHIVVPLLHAIYSEVSKIQSATLTEKVRTALLSIANSLTVSLGPVSVRGDALMSSGMADKIADLDNLFAKPFNDMKEVGKALGDRRIAVLIDDLDRCSPGKVISLLESINLVMDVPGFVFVLALDYDVLAKAVAVHYPHASGHVFIEKMVQVPFRVPRLDLPRKGFLSDLIPGWSHRSKSLPTGFEQVAHDVAIFGLDANPRQIKRLINSVLVLLSIARDRGMPTDVRLLGGLVGIQLRWPAEYADLVEAVLANDPDPLTPVKPEGQPNLLKYTARFFPEGTSALTLRPYLQLTQSVAVPSQSGAEESATPRVTVAAVREEHRTNLINALVKHGYEEGLADTYVHRRNPRYRVKIGKTVIRFESQNLRGVWDLGLSCRISEEEEYAKALNLINSRQKMVGEIRATLSRRSQAADPPSDQSSARL